MSRSKKKFVKVGFCVGSNTEFYREKRRKPRARMKQQVHDFSAGNIEDILPYKEIFHDDWNEPTDGGYLYFSAKKMINAWNVKDFHRQGKIKNMFK